MTNLFIGGKVSCNFELTHLLKYLVYNIRKIFGPGLFDPFSFYAEIKLKFLKGCYLIIQLFTRTIYFSFIMYFAYKLAPGK